MPEGPGDGGVRIKLLIAEPSPIAQAGLALLLEAQLGVSVAGTVGDAESLVLTARRLRPDVVVVESSFATPEVLERLATAGLCGRVVVLGDADGGAAREALVAGVAAFVLKRSVPDDLCNAVRAAASGRRYLDPALGALVAQRHAEESVLAALTDRQREVLRLLGLGHTNREVAAQLGVSVRTVEADRANLLDKLGLVRRADLVRYARERG